MLTWLLKRQTWYHVLAALYTLERDRLQEVSLQLAALSAECSERIHGAEKRMAIMSGDFFKTRQRESRNVRQSGRVVVKDDDWFLKTIKAILTPRAHCIGICSDMCEMHHRQTSLI